MSNHRSTEINRYSQNLFHVILRCLDKEALRSEKSLIQDKNARRLYLQIDGHKNIGELVYLTQLNIQEFYAALCLLLAQKCIQLFEARGYAGQNLQSSLSSPPVQQIE